MNRQATKSPKLFTNADVKVNVVVKNSENKMMTLRPRVSARKPQKKDEVITPKKQDIQQ